MSEFLSDSWAQWMIDVIVKASVCLLVGGTAALLLRRASSALRHLVWTLTLGSLLLLPALTFLPLPLRLTAPAVVPALFAPQQPRPVKHPDAPKLPASSSSTSVTAISSPIIAAEADHVAWPALFFWGWAIGCLVVATRWITAFYRVRQMTRYSHTIKSPALLTLLSQPADTLGLHRPIHFLQTDSTTHSPMTWGYLHPTLLLPAQIETWPEGHIRAVLLHELAHVRRRDWLLQTFAHFVVAFYWFHPLVWLAARQLRAESERACDDTVVNAGISSSEYAGYLLEVARTIHRRNRFAHVTAAMASSKIEARLRAILDSRQNRKGVSRNTILRASVLAIVACFALALVQNTVSGQAEQQGTIVDKRSSVAQEDIAPDVAYEAIIEEGNDGFFPIRHVQYDRGKYRVGINFNPKAQKAPGFFRIYDGKEPPIVWEYNEEARLAWPDDTSSWEAIQRTVAKYGEEEVQERYRIPTGVDFRTRWTRNKGTLQIWSPDSHPTWRLVGTEKVAGFSCEVHEGRFNPEKPFAIVSKDGRSMEGIFPTIERVWVEPRTRFVLRSEFRSLPVNGIKPIGDRRMVVKKLRFLNHLPSRTFALPSGITIRLPDTLKDVKLLPGTRRISPEGKFRYTGLDPRMWASHRRTNTR